MTKPFDPTKPCRTLGGQPVEIVATKGRAAYPILGYIGDSEALTSWTKHGELLKGIQQDRDLVNTPEVVKTYQAVYVHGVGPISSSVPGSGFGCQGYLVRTIEDGEKWVSTEYIPHTPDLLKKAQHGDD
jgi:hypothetical protein